MACAYGAVGPVGLGAVWGRDHSYKWLVALGKNPALIYWLDNGDNCGDPV